MRLFCSLLGAWGSVFLATNAEAAWPTKVMSAVEPDKPIPDINLSITYDRTSKSARITREWIQDENGDRIARDVRELDFSETTQRLNLGVRIGLYHDIELHIYAPIVLQNDSEIDFAEGVEGSSTICCQDSGNANNPAFDYRFPVTAVPASRQRAGFGDMTFGLSWSPFVDQKDEAWPTLTLTGDIIAPTGKRRDPTDPEALPGGDGGTVGLSMTVFDLSIGMSKRMRSTYPSLDPYMLFGARIPVPTSAQKAIGFDPSVSGRFKVGAELLMFEDKKTTQHYALDLSFGFRYIGIGRTYSELSDYLPDFNQRSPEDSMGNPRDTFFYDDFQDPENYDNQDPNVSCGLVTGVRCGELTRVDEHLQMTGEIAVHIQPISYAVIRAGVSLGFTTDHLLTAESVGTDTDPADASSQTCGTGPCVGRVNASNSQGDDERSNRYDPRYDTPGRRLRAEDITTFTFFVMAAAQF